MTATEQTTRKDKAIRTHGDKGYMVLGNITLDGPNGNIIIKDVSANDIVTIDSSGITINIPTSYDTFQEFINFKKVNIKVGGLALNRYVTGGVTVSDMIFRSYETSDNDRDTYSTMAVYGSNLSTRKNFYQISASYRGGVLTGYRWNFGVTAKFSTPVIETDVDGLGSFRMPQLASDPAVDNARMYYNTATGKVRVCEAGTWKNVI